MNPSGFRAQPMNSVKGSFEHETIARSIMVILARTGDMWRQLGWNEYEAERLKDKGFSRREQSYFNDVVGFTESEQVARLFSPVWKTATEARADTDANAEGR